MRAGADTTRVGTFVGLVTAAHAAAIAVVAGRLDRVVGVVGAAPGDWSRGELAAVGALTAAALAAAWIAWRTARSGGAVRRAVFVVAAGLTLGDGVASLAVFFQSLGALVLAAVLLGLSTGVGLRLGGGAKRVAATLLGAVVGALLGGWLVESFATLASTGAWETLATLALVGLGASVCGVWLLPREPPV